VRRPLRRRCGVLLLRGAQHDGLEAPQARRRLRAQRRVGRSVTEQRAASCDDIDALRTLSWLQLRSHASAAPRAASRGC
jgi:hypothetical protein